MSNMSYCRFQNTDSDLGDCQDALESLLNADSEMGPLSPPELAAAQSLVRRCIDIVELVAEEMSLDIDDLDGRRGAMERFLADANTVLTEEEEEEEEEGGAEAAR